MTTYHLSFGQAIGYQHPHPERTAVKSSATVWGHDTYQVWSNRPAMARTVRMQQTRAAHNQDWRPLVPLSDAEGY